MAGVTNQSAFTSHEDDTVLFSGLGISPDSIRGAEALDGTISGAAVQRLLIAPRVAPGATSSYFAYRVYKRIEPEGGWLGAASRDTCLRELRLHSSGLLADLPASLDTAVLACAEYNATDAQTPAVRRSAALLLADERGHLLGGPSGLPPGCLPSVARAMVSRLARLHARYWCDPRLAEPVVGLTPTRETLLLTSPATIAARLATGDPNSYLPLARVGWEAFFRLAAPHDAALLRGVLADPDRYVAAIDALPATLVHGDVWPPNLGWLPSTRRAPRRGGRLLLLDWALATAGPCTYDPLWLCGTWHALDPVRVLAAYRAALTRMLAARGQPLPAATWRSLADAGYLRTVLTCGEALGRVADDAPRGIVRQRAYARVRWWARRGARAAKRLVAQPDPSGVNVPGTS